MKRLRRVRVAPLGECTLGSVMRMRACFAQQWTWRILMTPVAHRPRRLER